MKWKERIESQGVDDETDIAFIDSDMYSPTVFFGNYEMVEDGRAYIM